MEGISNDHISVNYSEDNTMAIATLKERIEMKGNPSRFCIQLTLEGVFLLDGVRTEDQKEEVHRKCYDNLFPIAEQIIKFLTIHSGMSQGVSIQKRNLKQVNFGPEPEQKNGRIIDFPTDK